MRQNLLLAIRAIPLDSQFSFTLFVQQFNDVIQFLFNPLHFTRFLIFISDQSSYEHCERNKK